MLDLKLTLDQINYVKALAVAYNAFFDEDKSMQPYWACRILVAQRYLGVKLVNNSTLEMMIKGTCWETFEPVFEG